MAGAEKGEDDFDVPPLEDMTDVLQSFSKLTSDENSKSCNPFLEVQESSQEAENAKRIEKLLGKSGSKGKNPSKDSVNESKNQEVKQSTFGGFKKGFLLGKQEQPASKTSKPKETKQVRKIEELKPKAKNEKENPLVLSEVQEALAKQMPLLQSKDWITEDLLSKIQKNPKLLMQLQDPKFSQALAEFQSNPQQAIAAFQNNPELTEFIRDFCAIMGEHFTALGDKDTSKKSNASNETLKATASRSMQAKNNKPQSDADEAKMQVILSNPDIQNILAKPKIQNLISAMKSDPESSHRILATFGPEEHKDIQRLVEVGLLGVSRR